LQLFASEANRRPCLAKQPVAQLLLAQQLIAQQLAGAEPLVISAAASEASRKVY